MVATDRWGLRPISWEELSEQRTDWTRGQEKGKGKKVEQTEEWEDEKDKIKDHWET